jgi:hypothetical protein
LDLEDTDDEEEPDETESEKEILVQQDPRKPCIAGWLELIE